MRNLTHVLFTTAQSAGAVEYTDYPSAKGKTPPHNEYPGYDCKQSDNEAPIMLEI